jgi:hypothetical protein
MFLSEAEVRPRPERAIKRRSRSRTEVRLCLGKQLDEAVRKQRAQTHDRHVMQEEG